jgi:hypothetical protein
MLYSISNSRPQDMVLLLDIAKNQALIPHGPQAFLDLKIIVLANPEQVNLASGKHLEPVKYAVQLCLVIAM